MTINRLDVDFRGIVNVARAPGAWPSLDRNGRRNAGLSAPRRRRQVLFLSSTTVARSWMAAVLLADRCGEHAQPAFGSLIPASEIPATVTAAIDELTLRTPGDPILAADDLAGPPDLLIILGTPFPVAPSGMTEVRHWSIADPEGKSPRTVRVIRDILIEHVQTLATELSVAC